MTARLLRAGFDPGLIDRARSLMEAGERSLHDALVSSHCTSMQRSAVTPQSFSIAPGSDQVVAITALPQPANAYAGSITLSESMVTRTLPRARRNR